MAHPTRLRLPRDTGFQASSWKNLKKLVKISTLLLQQILANVWCNRWQKASTRKQPAQRRLRAYLCGGHSSVDKIIRGQHHEISFDNLPDNIKPQEASKDV